jgi:hypothetical protein
MEPWLSLHNGIGSKDIPISSKRDWIQTNCLVVSEIDMYSASVEDSAIDFCALKFQQNTPFANFTKYHVVDFLIVGSEA